MCAERTALTTPATARPAFVPRLFDIVTGIWRLWSNHCALRRLDELSDWELMDIGLTREDVSAAFEMPLLSNPTQQLQQIARARAREELMMRRRS